jgi:hypothetical protein
VPRLTRFLASAVALVSLVVMLAAEAAVERGRSLAQRATLLRSRPRLHLNTVDGRAFGGPIGLGRRLRMRPRGRRLRSPSAPQIVTGVLSCLTVET